MKQTLQSALAMLVAVNALGYDIHTKALTPVEEKPAPAGKAMRFVEEGRLRFSIATDDEARDAKAIALLKEVFARTAGESPQVVAAGAEGVGEDGNLPFRLVLASDKSLPAEGFRIRTSPDALTISGHTYYGALDFAERFLGVRWYFPGENGSIYPPCRNLLIAPVCYEDAPYFQSRGGIWYVRVSLRDAAQAERWAPFMGDVGPDDAVFVERWRNGGTLPEGGSHNPRPECIAKSHPDKLKTIFYTSPQGKFWYNPKAHIGNVFNVLDLEFADLLVEDWKHYLDAGRKSEADRGGFGYLVNNAFLSFGVCDTYLPLGEVMEHPIVKKLGLVTDRDLARDPDAAMANIYGRFYQYLARKAEREFPDKRLFILAYYNSKCASLDPRWTLPGNVEVNVCDGRLPLLVRNPDKMDASRQLFREWYEALGDRPVLKAWLYAPPTLLGGAIGPEFVGEVPKALGKYLGRGGVFYDFSGGRDLWHYYYSAYVCWRSQWNPDLDVDAAIDEMWDLCLGTAAGAKMKEFHGALKDAVVRYQVVAKDGFYNPSYPISVLDRLEALLAETKALLVDGSVEMKRFRLVADYLSEAFAQQRVRATYEPPVYAVHRLLDGETPLPDGVPDEDFWAKIPSMPFMDRFNGEPVPDAGSLKLAWNEKGIYAAFASDAGRPKTGDDLWANDTLELFFAQGLGKELLHQLAFDADGTTFTMRHRLLPIPQPEDRQWAADGHLFRAAQTESGWTAELFIPFSAFENGAPSVYDSWNFNCAVTRRASGPERSASTSLTGYRHAHLDMFGIIRFVGKGD